MPSPALDELLAALLRGDSLDRRAIKAFGSARIYDAARAHDVLPMVADRLALAPELPDDLRELFLEELHRVTAVDLAVEAELRRLHVACAARQVPLLLFKGSHLAYSHYPRPDLRARIDSDILIAREHRELVDEIFRADLGYDAPTKLSGELSATQTMYVKYEEGTEVHVVDLHWRLASPQVFAKVLSFEELYEASTPLPVLGAWARGPSNVHALLIACMHRVAHHHDEPDRFKWLFDIHLVASRFTPAEWTSFADAVLDRQVSAVCLDSLARAAEWFATPVPEAYAADVRFADARPREQTAAYLRTRPKASQVLDDLRALPRWTDRLQLLREHLFPAAAYMREVYAPGSERPLPVLYVQRALRGLVKWLS